MLDFFENYDIIEENRVGEKKWKLAVRKNAYYTKEIVSVVWNAKLAI